MTVGSFNLTWDVIIKTATLLFMGMGLVVIPILPGLVNRKGVTVKKKSPNVLMIVNLFSPPEPGHPVVTVKAGYPPKFAELVRRIFPGGQIS